MNKIYLALAICICVYYIFEGIKRYVDNYGSCKDQGRKIAEYLKMAAILTEETRGKRPGCISYSFNQSLDTPTEFVLYEQWESQAHLDNHIQELCKLLGQPKPGQPLPEKLMEMYEWARPVFYREIEKNV